MHMVFNAFIIFLSYYSVLRNDYSLETFFNYSFFRLLILLSITFFYAEEFVILIIFRIETFCLVVINL